MSIFNFGSGVIPVEGCLKPGSPLKWTRSGFSLYHRHCRTWSTRGYGQLRSTSMLLKYRFCFYIFCFIFFWIFILCKYDIIILSIWYHHVKISFFHPPYSKCSSSLFFTFYCFLLIMLLSSPHTNIDGFATLKGGH